jgi:hypothetical protein
MGIFRYIWNALFGKSNEQEKYKKGGIIEQEIKQETSIVKEVQQVQEPPKFADEKPVKKEKTEPKKKSKKMNIGKKTLSEIKEHILEKGSINTYACKQIFKVKSLHNFISALRGQGFVFITERVTIKDDSGQVIDKAVNYTLIDKK